MSEQIGINQKGFTQMTVKDTAPNKLTVDVWADVVCPWCYLGEHRLEEAIKDSPHADQIDLQIHTFQLHPNDSKQPVPVVDYLAKSHGVSAQQARQMEGQLGAQARQEGLVYEVDRPAADTLDMLRVVQYANTKGLGWPTMRAIQTYVFSGNEDAFDHAAILKVASEVGLDPVEVQKVLDSNQFAEEVRADHSQATQMGASGVPFTVLGSRLGIPGAVSKEQYGQALEQAWEAANG